MRRSEQAPVVFRLGVVLLCVLMLSFHLMGGLYARYTTTSAASDSARVAKFIITNEIGDFNTTESQPVSIDLHFFDIKKVEDTLTLQVSSGSEVAVEYDVVITMPAGVDYTWLEVKLGDKAPPTVNGNVFTFSEVSTFAPNDGNAHTYTLTFTIKSDYQGNPPTSLTNVTNGTVTITVHAEQID